MSMRNQSKHEKTFAERLADELKRLHEAANALPPGSQPRELLLERIRKTANAANLNAWLESPGLRPPK